MVFPAYNEESNIERLLLGFIQVLEGISYELIVVDDGSSDNTASIVQRLQTSYSCINLLQHGSNKGYGAALRSGFRASRGEWTFFTDADLQFLPQDFHTLWSNRAKSDIICGYRFPRKDPLFRKYNANLWRLYVGILFGVWLKDTNCACKLFPTNALQSVELLTEGACINAEIMVKLQRKKLRYMEVPVQHVPRQYGVQTGANPKVVYKALRESIRLYRSL